MDAKFLFEAMNDPNNGYWACDTCGSKDYTALNPFVEVRIPRPSDRADLCCILAGHGDCFGYRRGQENPSVKTPDEWTEYIESEDAMREGYLWLT